VKLVDQFVDPTEAAAARRQLREAGIACRVDSMDPHSVLPSRSGATHIGLWVLLDDQFEDALQILEKPAHRPRRILSPAEIEEVESSADRQTRRRRLGDKALTVLLLACLFALIVFTAVDFFLDL